MSYAHQLGRNGSGGPRRSLLVRLPMKAKGATTRSISMDPELAQEVEAHLRKMRPIVKGWSHYIQILITNDLKNARETQRPPGAV